jgi:hypothetical protein
MAVSSETDGVASGDSSDAVVSVVVDSAWESLDSLGCELKSY